jgi:hypothetical protein
MSTRTTWLLSSAPIVAGGVAVALAFSLGTSGLASFQSKAQGAMVSASAPAGALSPAEYRLMIRVARKVRRAERAHSLRAGLRRFTEACEILQGAPTPLLQATYNDCQAQIAILKALIAFARDTDKCAAREPTCLGPDLDAIAKQARNEVATATEANKQADARRIHGRCRQAVGVPDKDIRRVSRLARTAEAVNRALSSGNADEVERAGKRFASALKRLASGDDSNLVKLVKSCRRSRG